MSKRFTETGKWEKPWFCDLPPHLKCLWMYICDKSDSAGVWEPNWKIASMFIGKTVSAADLKYFEGRIASLPGGKLFVVPFIEFQYGKLSRECRPHIKIFESLSKHGIEYTPEAGSVWDRSRAGNVSRARRRAVYDRDGNKCVYCGSTESLEPDHILARKRGGSDAITNLVTACHECNTLKSDKLVGDFLALNPEKERVLEYLDRVSANADRVQDKEEEEEEDKDKDTEPPKNKARGTIEEIRTFCVEIGLHASDGDACFHKWEGKGWKNGGDPIKCWRSTVRSWKAAGYMPSQKAGHKPALETHKLTTPGPKGFNPSLQSRPQ